VLHTLSDDGVLEGTAVLDDEDGVRVATLSLTSAGNTTAVGLKTTVESARDSLGLLVGDRALGLGNGDGGTLAHGESLSRGGSGGAGSNGGHEGSDSGDDGELHFDSWLLGTLKVESRTCW
jgi:hypothetical protein